MKVPVSAAPPHRLAHRWLSQTEPLSYCTGGHPEFSHSPVTYRGSGFCPKRLFARPNNLAGFHSKKFSDPIDHLLYAVPLRLKAIPPVPPIVSYCIARQQPPHDRGDRHVTGS